MNVTILVPSEDYHVSAGARIRYGRLANGLALAGVNLRLQAIAQFEPRTADCDVLLVSKCHDARSIIAASVASQRGKLVGVDLFDDYFSQLTDSRLVGYREWLARLLEECDFCLCSTSTMVEVVETYKPGLPTQVVNDPARVHSVEAVLKLVETKVERAHRDRKIRAVWFGVGDNPYFQVGLTDLLAHASVLSELAHGDLTVELTVLTNRRSLGADGLELLSRLPVPCTVMEWSEDVERQVLEDSLLAFLPVAAQRFSSAKSLNRAFSALSYGCQILSVGHPLYAALGPLVYREPEDFISDLLHDSLRLSAQNSAVYLEKLRAYGSAESEALRLTEFLKGLSPSSAEEAVRLCVVHGLSTRSEIHHLTQGLGGLSVASPYCFANLDFDILFRGLGPQMTMAMSPRASSVAGNRSSEAERHARSRSGMLRKHLARAGEANPVSQTAGAAPAPLAYQLATYAASMRHIELQLKEAFGPIRLIVSETSRVPVSASVEA